MHPHQARVARARPVGVAPLLFAMAPIAVPQRPTNCFQASQPARELFCAGHLLPFDASFLKSPYAANCEASLLARYERRVKFLQNFDWFRVRLGRRVLGTRPENRRLLGTRVRITVGWVLGTDAPENRRLIATRV